MSPLSWGWDILTSALDGAPSPAQPWCLPGPAPAVPEEMFFLASSCSSLLLSCFWDFLEKFGRDRPVSGWRGSHCTASTTRYPGSTWGSPKLPNGRSMPSLSVKVDLTFGWDGPCICQVLINTLCLSSTRAQILSFCEFMKDKHMESSCSIGLGCSLQL